MNKWSIPLLVSIIVFQTSCRHDSDIPDFDVTPEAYVVNAAANSISVINLNTNSVTEEIYLPDSNFPYHIFISPDKRYLAISVVNHDMSSGFPESDFNSYSEGNKVLIMETATRNIIKEIPLSGLVSNAIFAAMGTELWVGQAGDIRSKILIYNINDWTLQDSIFLGKGLTDITFCSDGDMSFTCTSGDDSVQMYDSVTKEFLMKSFLASHPVGAYPSDHHTDFIVADANQVVYELNADDCMTIDTISLSYKPCYIQYNALYSEMWMTDITNNSVHWFKEIASHWTEQGEILVGENPRWIAFNGDNSIAYIVNQNSNSISLINVANHSVINSLSVGESPSSMAVKF